MPAWRNWLQTLLKREKQVPTFPRPTPSKSFSSSPSLTDSVYLLPIKDWVIQHISPFAWDRAVIRLLFIHKDTKLPLPELLKPSPSTRVPLSLYESISDILQEMYGIQLPVNLVAEQI
ncbi:MAG: hypothetical protein N2170_07490 [Bacteroidia bacterium]|nr:hypothetical protein [Bacteroidia bacterium]